LTIRFPNNAVRFKRVPKFRFKLCIRCISRADRVQW
jgi:hypothetical protein